MGKQSRRKRERKSQVTFPDMKAALSAQVLDEDTILRFVGQRVSDGPHPEHTEKSTCDSCHEDVWIGPNSAAKLAANPSHEVRCFPCLDRVWPSGNEIPTLQDLTKTRGYVRYERLVRRNER